MEALLMALLVQAAGSESFGPDAARISELEFKAGLNFCDGHNPPCRDWRMIVSDVRCRPDPADGRRALCAFKQQIPGLPGAEACSATFEATDGVWYHPHLPDRDGPTSRNPELRLGDSHCSAVGAPDSAAIKAIREAAHPQLGCVLYPDPKRSCPPASATPRDVSCSRWGNPAFAHCMYRLSGAEDYSCNATFRLERDAWVLTGGISRDGRFIFDENCR